MASPGSFGGAARFGEERQRPGCPRTESRAAGRAVPDGASGGGALKAYPVLEIPAAGLQDPEIARPYQVRGAGRVAKTSFASNLCKRAKSLRGLCPG